MEIPDGYRVFKGRLWPAHDEHCHKVIDDLTNLKTAIGCCHQTRVAVQAGGNCGVWPHAMGATFDHVYTFEPDPMNFRCLCFNAPGENVHKFNAALGDRAGSCEIDDSQEGRANIGAYQVEETTEGHIPMMTVDDLNLPACDLIYLDIEGYELMALRGAVTTIDLHRPVIGIEDKGLSERYGYAKEDAVRYVESMGYKVVARPGRDVLLVPL